MIHMFKYKFLVICLPLVQFRYFVSNCISVKYKQCIRNKISYILHCQKKYKYFTNLFPKRIKFPWKLNYISNMFFFFFYQNWFSFFHYTFFVIMSIPLKQNFMCILSLVYFWYTSYAYIVYCYNFQWIFMK